MLVRKRVMIETSEHSITESGQADGANTLVPKMDVSIAALYVLRRSLTLKLSDEQE